MVPPPAFDQPVYSPQKIAVVVAELAEQGVAPSAALEGTGLDPAHWHDPTQPIYRFVVEFALSMHLTVALDSFARRTSKSPSEFRGG